MAVPAVQGIRNITLNQHQPDPHADTNRDHQRHAKCPQSASFDARHSADELGRLELV